MIHQIFLYYLLAVNVIAVAMYGIDKFKAKKSMWRIPERNLLLVAVLGGSVGAMVGMSLFHHKTRHKKFAFGLPLILIAQIAMLLWWAGIIG